MRGLCGFLSLALTVTVGAAEFRLQLRPRAVYVVRMSNGLDAYLASRLTSAHVVWIVLEPAKADAVLTDHIDESFWAWSVAHYRNDPKKTSEQEPPQGARPRDNRGTIFLVDPRAGLVLWSVYEPASSTSPKALDKAAEHVALSLKKKLELK
jgi:hypothetical protein